MTDKLSQMHASGILRSVSFCGPAKRRQIDSSWLCQTPSDRLLVAQRLAAYRTCSRLRRLGGAHVPRRARLTMEANVGQAGIEGCFRESRICPIWTPSQSESGPWFLAASTAWRGVHLCWHSCSTPFGEPENNQHVPALSITSRRSGRKQTTVS
jgi:hypothetical protein